MAVSDVANVLSTARWSEDAFYLKEFVHKFKLPQIGKVVKGQYQSLGSSTLSSPSLNSNVLLASGGKRQFVIAQSVKFKDGKPGKVVPVGTKLAIPDSYEGYFEILSEDGRSVKCIESVAELARRFPDSVLVRENCKAFVSKSDDIETIQDKSRIILSGEVLILVGEVLGVRGKTQTRFLRCFDKDGENVYLPYEQKGKFSAIAKEENISGVHNIRNLEKKRLPLMVRLASGSPPVGLKSAQLFLPELRLLERVDEEILLALPLTKEPSVVPLPMGAVLKLQPCINPDYIQGMKEITRLVEKAVSQMAELADRILVHDVASPHIKAAGEEEKKVVRRSGGEQRNSHARLSGHSHTSPHHKPTSNSTSGPSDYDEIDQIYDYVRGFAPLPKSAKGWQYIAEKTVEQVESHWKETVYQKLSKPTSQKEENKPPSPPPIETIPGKKNPNTPMDLSPPTTPPYSSPWGSPAHVMAPLGPNGQMIGIVPPPHLVIDRPLSADEAKIYENGNKGSESKKRQRPKTAVAGVQDSKKENYESAGRNLDGGAYKPWAAAGASTPPNRYIKASNKQNTNSKHKFFRSKTKEKVMETAPPPMGSLSASSGYRGHGFGTEISRQGQPSFFHLRYKSLTNLAHQEYDTLDSSNSGGKTSFDSAGSRHVPEKKSRKLARPKSLTNLVWDLRNGGGAVMERSSSKPSLLASGNMGLQVPGGFVKRRLSKELSPGSGGVGRKMGSNKMATLYL